MGLGEMGHGMDEVEHGAVDQHQGAVEDVEEGFVFVQVAVVALEDLDDAVDVADEDHPAAGVEQADDGLQLAVEDAAPETSLVEDDR